MKYLLNNPKNLLSAINQTSQLTKKIYLCLRNLCKLNQCLFSDIFSDCKFRYNILTQKNSKNTSTDSCSSKLNRSESKPLKAKTLFISFHIDIKMNSQQQQQKKRQLEKNKTKTKKEEKYRKKTWTFTKSKSNEIRQQT